MRRMTASQERTLLRGAIERTRARLEDFLIKAGGQAKVDLRPGWAIVESLRSVINGLEIGIEREAGNVTRPRRNPS